MQEWAPRTGERILAEILDGAAFANGAKLAAYVGLGSVTRAVRHQPQRRATGERAEGKRNNAAAICLARRRCDHILAKLRNRQPYQPDRTQVAAAA